LDEPLLLSPQDTKRSASAHPAEIFMRPPLSAGMIGSGPRSRQRRTDDASRLNSGTGSHRANRENTLGENPNRDGPGADRSLEERR